jgi:hypothetical protein
MRNYFVPIFVFGLFVTTYLLAAMMPVATVAWLNYAIAPLDCWPAMAETWLANQGVPYPGFAMVAAYSGAVFFPSIKFAAWLAFDVVDERLTA